ncbi:hypothetical protein JCM10908_004276 [Rhodotorula pacifica]|uniref:uncharacterized protein n=1 Tax=Rhodotorula pacifica TaxID=1495444 RepID=UPI00316FBB69
MSAGRQDPRDRVEQSQLAAALAASARQVETEPEGAAASLPLPTATKYGDLGSGTLLTTTTETTTTTAASASGSAVERKSSDEQLLSSVNNDDAANSNKPLEGVRIEPSDPSNRSRLPSSMTSSARSRKRTLIDTSDSIVAAATTTDDASRSMLAGMDTGALTGAFGHDTVMEDDTAEVIGDSDEESRPSNYILSEVSQHPLAKPTPRASTATSSIVDPTASSAVPGPSKQQASKATCTADSIVMTTTNTPSSRTNSASSKSKYPEFDLEVIIPAKPARRTSTTTSTSTASAKGKARASITSKPIAKSVAEDSGDETDYDALPGQKPSKKATGGGENGAVKNCKRAGSGAHGVDGDKAALPAQKNRTRTSTIMRESPPLAKNGSVEEVPASDDSEDPLLMGSDAGPARIDGERPRGSKAPRPRRQLIVEESDEENAPATEEANSASATTRGDDANEPDPKSKTSVKRTGSKRVAVSEDEDGVREAQEAAIRALEQADELDDDYGGSSSRAKKGKGAAKGAARKRTRSSKGGAAIEESAAAEGDAAPKKAGPRRPPTITKDDAPPPAKKRLLPQAAVDSSSVSPETTRKGRPTRNKPKRLATAFINESPVRRAEPPPAPVPAPAPIPATFDEAAAATMAEALSEADVAMMDKPASTRTNSKKRLAVHDSEEEGAQADAVDGSAAIPVEVNAEFTAEESVQKEAELQPKVVKPSTAASTSRRTTAKQRKQVVPSSDAEDEGAASDATSAIKTGDEFSDDDDEEPVRGGRKGGKKAAAPPSRANSAASKASTKPAATKRPRLSTSPNRSRGRSASMEEKIEQMMKAAAGEDEHSLLLPASRSSSTNVGENKGKAAASDDEAEEEDEMPASSPDGESKENEGSAITKAGKRDGESSTSGPARARSASMTPFSKAPRPGSLAAIMAKKGLATFRAPGLSARQRVPPLHTNLKPPPPAKKALPEKKVKKKKGDESYSDEEKPWYKRKDPEEWDDEDHRRWQKRLRRIDRGLPPDSDDD